MRRQKKGICNKKLCTQNRSELKEIQKELTEAEEEIQNFTQQVKEATDYSLKVVDQNDHLYGLVVLLISMKAATVAPVDLITRIKYELPGIDMTILKEVMETGYLRGTTKVFERLERQRNVKKRKLAKQKKVVEEIKLLLQRLLNSSDDALLGMHGRGDSIA